MTPRQAQILAAIIEQYAKTAEPISSLGLAEKFDISTATIRGDMGVLEQLGYIYQPHISAGRVPTDGSAVMLAVGNIKRPVDEHGEAQTRACSKFQHADIAFDTVAKRH